MSSRPLKSYVNAILHRIGPYRPDEITGPALPGDIRDVARKAVAYAPELKKIKAKANPAPAFWYPYSTMGNFSHLDRLLTGRNRMILDLIGDRPIADIGAADGDLAFFFETLSVKAHIIDNGPTNFNGLRGARLLKETLQSSVEVHEVDLDAQFRLPDADFGLIFFLNILYHLKNPYFALEELAKRTTHCLISTRVIQYLPDRRTGVSGGALAYLVDERECNDDPTNFWMFTEKGLRRILARTNWDVLELITVGATNRSDPVSANGDERAYCLVKSRVARAAKA